MLDIRFYMYLCDINANMDKIREIFNENLLARWSLYVTITISGCGGCRGATNWQQQKVTNQREDTAEAAGTLLLAQQQTVQSMEGILSSLLPSLSCVECVQSIRECRRCKHYTESVCPDTDSPTQPAQPSAGGRRMGWWDGLTQITTISTSCCGQFTVLGRPNIT